MSRATTLLGAMLVFGFFALLGSSQTKRKPPTPIDRYSKCVSLLPNIEPLRPYMFKTKLDSELNEKEFWDSLARFYPSASHSIDQCAGVVTKAEDSEAVAYVYIMAFTLQRLRAEALKLAVKQLSEENEKLEKEVSAYIELNQQYQEAEREYVHKLDLYARQAEQQQAEQRQAFLETLVLLRALSPPPAPRIFYTEQARQAPTVSAPTVNLGIHCTVQPTVTGQTFIRCY